jgi:hypothetical protein
MKTRARCLSTMLSIYFPKQPDLVVTPARSDNGMAEGKRRTPPTGRRQWMGHLQYGNHHRWVEVRKTAKAGKLCTRI